MKFAQAAFEAYIKAQVERNACHWQATEKWDFVSPQQREVWLEVARAVYQTLVK